MIIQNAFGISAGGFEALFANRDQVHRNYAQMVEQIGATTQARDWIYRTWAIESHDIAAAPPFNGDLRAAARSIRARLLLIPNCFDQLLPPTESGVLEVAMHAPDAKIVDIDDLGGHGGTRSPRGIAVITTETRDLLARIEQGRPGFSGPRYPRHWARPDRCPG
jgi:homoserine O-acetyltransferase